MPAPRHRDGLILGISAYVWWGFFPLYIRLAKPTGSYELVAHRIVWSLAICLILLVATRQWRRFLEVLGSGRLISWLSLAGLLLMFNWSIFIYATLTDQLVDAALGYYLNPLVSIALGVGLLRERLAVAQWAAVAVAGIGVLAVWLSTGHLPWISLVLAFTFGFYGYIEKVMVGGSPALVTLTIETLATTPLALVFLAVWGATGRQTFLNLGAGHVLVLLGMGIATAVPLLLINGAFRRLPLSVIGQLQFLCPTLQFLVGVLLLGESMPLARWVGFVTVWLALAILGVHATRASAVVRES